MQQEIFICWTEKRDGTPDRLCRTLEVMRFHFRLFAYRLTVRMFY